MTKEKRMRFAVDMSRWFVSCSVVGMIMYHYPLIPLGPALVAGIGTGVIIAWQSLRRNDETN
jgi:hypothetical protein